MSHFHSLTGQVIEEKIHKKHIKTVKINRKEEPLTLPVIPINSNKQVTLSFDDLEPDSKTYSYKLIHCNANWEPSGLMEQEYISGQFTAEIQNYRSSFNTIIPYRHYELDIPNENIKPTISGNYTILVYQNYTPEDTVLTQRFRITENLATLSPEMYTFNKMSKEKPNQQLELSINTGTLYVGNPSDQIKIAIQKNYHGEKVLEGLDPDNIRGNTLTYRNNKQMVFMGGNEFLHFNTKSKDYESENIATIDFIQNNFHFRLKPDKDRSFEDYKAKQEINGRYQVDKERTENPSTEADYVYVYFTLKDKTPELEGGVYVTGAFNNWKKNQSSKMRYNMEQKTYEKRFLLKQGYYNYKYVLKNFEGFDPYYYSGNHYQTENEYQIYIYYKDLSEGYDRLIGHTVFNSSTVQY